MRVSGMMTSKLARLGVRWRRDMCCAAIVCPCPGVWWSGVVGCVRLPGGPANVQGCTAATLRLVESVGWPEVLAWLLLDELIDRIED